MKYLLDSNILVDILQGRFHLDRKLSEVGWENCCISEISVVELLYGAEISSRREENIAAVEDLISDLEIIPFSVCIKEFCHQKALLKKNGKLIEDYVLFIGSTAIALDCILVSENVKHLSRLEGIKLENWVVR